MLPSLTFTGCHRFADARMRGERIGEQAERAALGFWELVIGGALVGVALIAIVAAATELARRADLQKRRRR